PKGYKPEGGLWPSGGMGGVPHDARPLHAPSSAAGAALATCGASADLSSGGRGLARAMRWGNRVETRFPDNELAFAPKRPSEHRPLTSGAPISSHPSPLGFSYSLTLLRLRCFGSWRGFSFAWAAGWRQGSGSPPQFQSGSRKTGWPRGFSGTATKSCGETGSFAPCDRLPRH